MGQLGQAQAGDQREQGAIGNRTGVVPGLGLSAKGKRHRLSLWAARQAVAAVPGARQCQGQQADKGQAHDEVWRDPGRSDLQCPGTQPVGQERINFWGSTAQQGGQPVGMTQCQLPHIGKGADVGTAPGHPANKARQEISQAKQQQGHAGQTPHGSLSNDGWAGLVHAGLGRRFWSR